MDRLLLKRQVYLRSSTTNIERELHKDLRDFVFVDFTLLPVPEIKHHKHCERKLHKDLRDLVLVDFTLLSKVWMRVLVNLWPVSGQVSISGVLMLILI